MRWRSPAAYFRERRVLEALIGPTLSSRVPRRRSSSRMRRQAAACCGSNRDYVVLGAKAGVIPDPRACDWPCGGGAPGFRVAPCRPFALSFH